MLLTATCFTQTISIKKRLVYAAFDFFYPRQCTRPNTKLYVLFLDYKYILGIIFVHFFVFFFVLQKIHFQFQSRKDFSDDLEQLILSAVFCFIISHCVAAFPYSAAIQINFSLSNILLLLVLLLLLLSIVLFFIFCLVKSLPEYCH